jgi:hypothetical protein
MLTINVCISISISILLLLLFQHLALFISFPISRNDSISYLMHEVLSLLLLLHLLFFLRRYLHGLQSFLDPFILLFFLTHAIALYYLLCLISFNLLVSLLVLLLNDQISLLLKPLFPLFDLLCSLLFCFFVFLQINLIESPSHLLLHAPTQAWQ